MDIANLSIALSHNQLQQQASLLVTKKAMAIATQQGQALTDLLQSSNVQAIQHAAEPHIGGNVDLKI